MSVLSGKAAREAPKKVLGLVHEVTQSNSDSDSEYGSHTCVSAQDTLYTVDHPDSVIEVQKKDLSVLEKKLFGSEVVHPSEKQLLGKNNSFSFDILEEGVKCSIGGFRKLGSVIHNGELLPLIKGKETPKKIVAHCATTHNRNHLEADARSSTTYLCHKEPPSVESAYSLMDPLIGSSSGKNHSNLSIEEAFLLGQCRLRGIVSEEDYESSMDQDEEDEMEEGGSSACRGGCYDRQKCSFKKVMCNICVVLTGLMFFIFFFLFLSFDVYSFFSKRRFEREWQSTGKHLHDERVPELGLARRSVLAPKFRLFSLLFRTGNLHSNIPLSYDGDNQKALFIHSVFGTRGENQPYMVVAIEYATRFPDEDVIILMKPEYLKHVGEYYGFYRKFEQKATEAEVAYRNARNAGKMEEADAIRKNFNEKIALHSPLFKLHDTVQHFGCVPAYISGDMCTDDQKLELFVAMSLAQRKNLRRGLPNLHVVKSNFNHFGLDLKQLQGFENTLYNNSRLWKHPKAYNDFAYRLWSYVPVPHAISSFLAIFEVLEFMSEYIYPYYKHDNLRVVSCLFHQPMDTLTSWWFPAHNKRLQKSLRPFRFHIDSNPEMFIVGVEKQLGFMHGGDLWHDMLKFYNIGAATEDDHKNRGRLSSSSVLASRAFRGVNIGVEREYSETNNEITVPLLLFPVSPVLTPLAVPETCENTYFLLTGYDENSQDHKIKMVADRMTTLEEHLDFRRTHFDLNISARNGLFHNEAWKVNPFDKAMLWRKHIGNNMIGNIVEPKDAFIVSDFDSNSSNEKEHVFTQDNFFKFLDREETKTFLKQKVMRAKNRLGYVKPVNHKLILFTISSWPMTQELLEALQADFKYYIEQKLQIWGKKKDGLKLFFIAQCAPNPDMLAEVVPEEYLYFPVLNDVEAREKKKWKEERIKRSQYLKFREYNIPNEDGKMVALKKLSFAEKVGYEFFHVVKSEHFATLMPHVDLVIHHGGTGVSAETARNGKPSIILPFYSEQVFNAKNLESTGAGRFINPVDYLNQVSNRGDKIIVRTDGTDDKELELCREGPIESFRPFKTEFLMETDVEILPQNMLPFRRKIVDEQERKNQMDKDQAEYLITPSLMGLVFEILEKDQCYVKASTCGISHESYSIESVKCSEQAKQLQGRYLKEVQDMKALTKAVDFIHSDGRIKKSVS